MVGGANGALCCKAEGKSRKILFDLCDHAHFDLGAYSAFFADQLVDQGYDDATLTMLLAGLPSVPAWRARSRRASIRAGKHCPRALLSCLTLRYVDDPPPPPAAGPEPLIFE
jgi:hypothetical protein